MIKVFPPCSMFGIPVSTSAAISGYRLSVERITRLRRDWKFLSVFSFLPTSSHLKGLRTTWTASQIFQNKTRTLCSRQILVFYASIHFCDLITMNYYANSFFAQENADLLVSLRGAIFFDSKKKGVDQVLISMGIGEWPRFLSHGAI